MKDHEFHRHFPDEVSPKLLDYITNSVMDWSRYLFTRREGRRQWAYCTHCRQEHPTEATLRHGSMEQCPHCGSAGHVKASGRGRKMLIDHAYLLWYERSRVSPDMLIARGFYATRDYREDYRKTRTRVIEIARYLFVWGQGGYMMDRTYWTEKGRWHTREKVASEVRRAMRQTLSYHMPPDEIAKVVQGTPFQYCTWERYNLNDYVEVFDLTARYPCIEFLTKAGFAHFVRQKLEGGQTYGAINWHGKTPQKVLRISKAEIKELKRAGSIGLRTLRHYQISQKEGSNLTFEESRNLSDLIEPPIVHELKVFLSGPLNNRFDIGTIKRYFLKQMRNHSIYRTGNSVLTDYRDYLRECVELGIDLERPAIIIPNNLHQAHEETMRRVKVNADKAIRQKIRDRFQQLNPMRFQYKDLILFPAASVELLVREGKVLNHCVGGYTTKYANGFCDIYFIRRKDDPDKPYYTMEVGKGEVRQCRGFKNRGTTPEVEEFVEQFTKKMLNKRSASKSKSQGVAI